MKVLVPSTPRARTPKVLLGARVIMVTVEILARRVKVKLLVHCGEGMARIDGSKSSHQLCNPIHLVFRIGIQVIELCCILLPILLMANWRKLKKQATRINITETLVSTDFRKRQNV